ncbi:hypothetical protein ACHAWF_005447 [Thalassiosira exigua]
MATLDLVTNHLRDPNSPIEIRNAESSSRSCLQLVDGAGKNLIPDKGIVLSTGAGSVKFGGGASEDARDPDLESQLPNGAAVYDACYVQFEFQCPAGSKSVGVDYVFGSDEYGKRHDMQNNDAVAILLNGENIARVPGGADMVSVYTVNGKNAEYFVENAKTGSAILRAANDKRYPSVPAKGFTTELRASGAPRSGWNAIKFVVGDVGDSDHDSWVMLDAGSFACGASPAEYVPTWNKGDGQAPSPAVPPVTAPTFAQDVTYYRGKGMPKDAVLGSLIGVGLFALLFAGFLVRRKKLPCE